MAVKLCRVEGRRPRLPRRSGRDGQAQGAGPPERRDRLARLRRSPADVNRYLAALFFLVPEPGALPILAASGWPIQVPYEKQRMQVKV
jgi:hypothetical protein